MNDNFKTITAATHSGAFNDGVKSIAAATYTGGLARTIGDISIAATTADYGKACCSGTYSAAVSLGTNGSAEVKNSNSIAIGLGIDSKVKGEIGDWLVLADWDYDGEISTLIGVYSFCIDGIKYKPNTWYRILNNKITQVQNKEEK